MRVIILLLMLMGSPLAHNAADTGETPVTEILAIAAEAWDITTDEASSEYGAGTVTINEIEAFTYEVVRGGAGSLIIVIESENF